MRSFPFPKILAALSLLVLCSGLTLFGLGQASGAQLFQRSLTLSDGNPSATNIYQLAFTPSSDASEIVVDFCSSSPLPGDPCTATGGIDVPDTSGITATNIAPISDGSTSHTIVITNQTLTAGTPYSITIPNIINPSIKGTFFARLFTYSTGGSSSYVPLNSNTTPPTEGSYLDHGGLALSTIKVINISTIVPPFLKVCVGTTITNFDCSTANGNFNEFGSFSTNSTSKASNQVVVATNASDGYTMTVSGTTLTSGNNIIPAMNTDDISKMGTSQFGINLRQNSIPPIGQNVSGPGIGSVSLPYSQPNLYRFVSGDIISSSTVPADNNKYTISYIVNISRDQPVGVYDSTLTYIGLANF